MKPLDDLTRRPRVPASARVVAIEMPGHQLRGRRVGDRAVISVHANAATGPIGTFSLPLAAVDDLGAAFRSLAAQLSEDA